MPRLTINGRVLDAGDGQTILEGLVQGGVPDLPAGVPGRPPDLGFGTYGSMSRHWRSVRPVGYGVRLKPGRLETPAYWTSSQMPQVVVSRGR